MSNERVTGAKASDQRGCRPMQVQTLQTSTQAELTEAGGTIRTHFASRTTATLERALSVDALAVQTR